MNNVTELENKVKFITGYVKELNDYMSGKDEADFRKDGVAPLEQHLMSIQLMTLTSAMIAMNDRLAILRNKAPAKQTKPGVTPDGRNLPGEEKVEGGSEVTPPSEEVIESEPPVLEAEEVN